MTSCLRSLFPIGNQSDCMAGIRVNTQNPGPSLTCLTCRSRHSADCCAGVPGYAFPLTQTLDPRIWPKQFVWGKNPETLAKELRSGTENKQKDGHFQSSDTWDSSSRRNYRKLCRTCFWIVPKGHWGSWGIYPLRISCEPSEAPTFQNGWPALLSDQSGSESKSPLQRAAGVHCQQL